MCRYKESQLPEGFKVKVRHIRGADAWPFRWRTEVRIEDPQRFTILSANSFCGPKDNPSRKIGRTIAVNRALNKYFSKDFTVEEEPPELVYGV